MLAMYFVYTTKLAYSKFRSLAKKDFHTVCLSYPVKILLVAMDLRRLHIRTLLEAHMRIAAKTNRRCIE